MNKSLNMAFLDTLDIDSDMNLDTESDKLTQSRTERVGQTQFFYFGLGHFALLIEQLICAGILDQVKPIRSHWRCTQQGVYNIPYIPSRK